MKVGPLKIVETFSVKTTQSINPLPQEYKLKSDSIFIICNDDKELSYLKRKLNFFDSTFVPTLDQSIEDLTLIYKTKSKGPDSIFLYFSNPFEENPNVKIQQLIKIAQDLQSKVVFVQDSSSFSLTDLKEYAKSLGAESAISSIYFGEHIPYLFR